MSPDPEPEITLYDLACTKNVCFSPVVWRIRLLLNYKRVPYRTVFLEFRDIEPTLEKLGIPPHRDQKHRYTVPAIHHGPSDTYIMDSLPIADFIQSTYPSPPVRAVSSAADLEARIRAASGPVLFRSITPREVRILSPRAADYFRRSREAALGGGGARLEDMLRGEDERWEAARGAQRAVDELLAGILAGGRFLGGDGPSMTDFFVAGSLQSTRTIDEGVFRRSLVGVQSYRVIYEACLPWMERKD